MYRNLKGLLKTLAISGALHVVILYSQDKVIQVVVCLFLTQSHVNV